MLRLHHRDVLVHHRHREFVVRRHALAEVGQRVPLRRPQHVAGDPHAVVAQRPEDERVHVVAARKHVHVGRDVRRAGEGLGLVLHPRHLAEARLAVGGHRARIIVGGERLRAAAYPGIAAHAHGRSDGLRVEHRAVVVVHQVFERELPVAVHLDDQLVGDAAVLLLEEGELVVVGRDPLLPRHRVVVERDEDPARPGAQRHRLEATVFLVPAHRLVHAWCADQFSFQVVEPAVVRAGELLGVARLLRNGHAAMSATVHEGVQLARLVARHDERLVDDAESQVVAGLFDFLDPGDRQPVLEEDLLLLDLVHLGRCVEVPRQVSRLVQGLAGFLDAVGRAIACIHDWILRSGARYVSMVRRSSAKFAMLRGVIANMYTRWVGGCKDRNRPETRS